MRTVPGREVVMKWMWSVGRVGSLFGIASLALLGCQEQEADTSCPDGQVFVAGECIPDGNDAGDTSDGDDADTNTGDDTGTDTTPEDSTRSGCTDPFADNYDADATVDDGSCTYSEVALPFNVDDYYRPSGFMGDGELGTIEADIACPTRAGDQAGLCHGFSYTADANDWGGVWWQFPENNWGDDPGLEIAPGATTITFWAWGKDGGEVIKFIAGYASDGFERDTGDLTLTTTPTEYTLSLTGVSYTDVAGGFGWVAPGPANTIEFYIDDITWGNEADPTPVPMVAAPTPTEDAADVIAVFSNTYDDLGPDLNPDWGQATTASVEQIEGDDTLRYGGLNYQGIDFNGEVDVSGMTKVHIDFWTADATAVNFYLISSGPVEHAVALPITTGEWVSVDIPLGDFVGVDLSSVIQFKFDDAATGEAATIYIDNLYFFDDGAGIAGCTDPAADNYNPAATEDDGSCVTLGAPTTAAPTPTVDAAEVSSAFSNVYTNFDGVVTDPDWGQATDATVEMVAGDETLKYSGLNYQGLDFNGERDVSGHTHLHVDFWTPDATAVNFYLISTGPVETAFALPIQTGQWVSIDIPLADFAPVDLTKTIQFKVDDAGTGESATIYFDNLYFHGVAGGNVMGCTDAAADNFNPQADIDDGSCTYTAAPMSPAPDPTHPQADVTSAFSDTYVDFAGAVLDPDWGQSTDATVEAIMGNDTLKYAGLNYQGLDFNGEQNISDRTHLHIDFWTPDATAVNFYLISPGNEKAYALPIQTGQWVSVDVPLSFFDNVDLTRAIQFKVDDAATGEAATIYFDNLYFYNDGSNAVMGCTDPAADNYNALATVDDGSCVTTPAPMSPAPAPTLPQADVTSAFSDVYVDFAGADTNPNWGQATITTVESIMGDDTLKYAGLNYQGFDFNGEQNISNRTHLHIDFWTPDATAVNFYLISPGNEKAYALPIQTNQWVSIDVPLSYFDNVDLTRAIQFKVDDATTGEAATIYFDNLYFYDDGSGAVMGCTDPAADNYNALATVDDGSCVTTPAPMMPAPAPTLPQADVTSAFSDVYTDFAGADTNPNWGQATISTVESIMGNDTLKYAGLNYQGFDFNGAQDVSNRTHVHLDFWTPDATAVNFYLISAGNETAFALPIATNQWVSVDVPLSHFANVDLTQAIQFKFDDAATGEAATIYLDNLYFFTGAATPGCTDANATNYNAAATVDDGSCTYPAAPSAAAPTPTLPAASVMSVYSNAYTSGFPATNFNPGWGQATVHSDEVIGGNDTLKYAGLNYQGIDFNGSFDISAYTMMHLDIWTPTASTINLFLISAGPAETPVVLPASNGEWVSVDIPLSDYTSVVDLSTVIQLKLDDAGTGEGADIFIDNIYFY